MAIIRPTLCKNRKGGLHTLEAIAAFTAVLGFIVFVMPGILNGTDTSELQRSYIYESLSNLEKTGKLNELAAAENLSGILIELNRTPAAPIKFTVGLSVLNVTFGTVHPKEWLYENTSHSESITFQRKTPYLSEGLWVLRYQYASDHVKNPIESGGYFSNLGTLNYVDMIMDTSESGMCSAYNETRKYWWVHMKKEAGNSQHVFYIEFNTSANDPDTIDFTFDVLEKQDTGEDPDCDPTYNDSDLAEPATDMLSFNDGTGIPSLPYTIRASPYREPATINFTANTNTLDSATLELNYINARSPIIYVNGIETAYHEGNHSGNSETLDITPNTITGQNIITIKSSDNATIDYRLRILSSLELSGRPAKKNVNTVTYIVAGSGLGSDTFKPMEIRVYVWK